MCPPSHPAPPTQLTWLPLKPVLARVIMSGIEPPWWIAGGWAIDLFLGTETRAHKDLDVGVWRTDAPRIIAALPEWEFFEAKDGVISALAPGAEPRTVVNSLWGRRHGEPHWSLELMLDDSDGTDWIFRRESSIRRPLSAALRATPDGTRYLSPELQLMYKARDLRPEDQSDFDHAGPRLDGAAAEWLRSSLAHLYPQHPWIPALAEPHPGRNDASRQV